MTQKELTPLANDPYILVYRIGEGDWEVEFLMDLLD